LGDQKVSPRWHRRKRAYRVHLCKRGCLRRTSAIPLSLLGLPAILLDVVRVPRPIRPPIVAMASRPATLRPRLIVPVITITVPLGALPDPSPATPTISVPAILLIANSRTRPECLAARGASPFLHRTSSPSQPERSSLPDQLTVQSLSPVRGDTIDAGQFTGSILVSTTGSILMSAKAWRRGPIGYAAKKRKLPISVGFWGRLLALTRLAVGSSRSM
jgi:hypothetical protein